MPIRSLLRFDDDAPDPGAWRRRHSCILFVLVQSTSPLQREIGRTAFATMAVGTSIGGIVGLVRSSTRNYMTAFVLCVVFDLVAAGIVL